MFFKHAKIYQVTAQLSLEGVEDKLAEFPYRRCGPQDLSTIGWIPPQFQQRAHVVNNCYLFGLCKEEKLLPARVINEMLQDRVEEIEEETRAPVGKKARMDLKQEIIHQLLPQAFTTRSYIYGAYLAKSNVIVVDSISDGRAELFLAMLRKALGSLPVVPLCRRSISYDLTNWLKSAAPDEFQVLENAKLHSTGEEGGKSSFKNEDLLSEEMTSFIDGGRQVSELAIEWDETFNCILCEDGSLKWIKFSDIIREQNEDIPKDQVAARFDADLALCLGELERFVSALSTTFDMPDCA